MISVKQSISCSHIYRKQAYFTNTRNILWLSYWSKRSNKLENLNCLYTKIRNSRKCSYIRNSIFIKDDNVSCQWCSAKCSKSLRLQWTSHEVTRCKLSASTTFNYWFVIRLWRKPEVIINIWSFSNWTKWSAYNHSLIHFSYKLTVLLRCRLSQGAQ